MLKKGHFGEKSLKDLRNSVLLGVFQGSSLAVRERLDPKSEGVVDGPLRSCLQASEGLLCLLQELTSHKQEHEETVNVRYAVGSRINSLLCNSVDYETVKALVKGKIKSYSTVDNSRYHDSPSVWLKYVHRSVFHR